MNYNFSMSVTGPDKGISLGDLFSRPMKNTSGGALAKGDIVQIKTTVVGASPQFEWQEVIGVADLTTTATETAIFGVVVDAAGIANNAIGKIGFIGDYECFVVPSVTAGAALSVDTDAGPTNKLVASTDDTKVVAWALATINNAVGYCRFNGWTGWGHAQ